MRPYWQDASVALYLGDCLEVLAGMGAASVDAVVTDPPAGVSFMGRDWDSNLGHRDRWIEWLAERMSQALRVLKPGGHALVWALPRTAGWTQIALEDAGFEVRDCISHIFGSGFPKSLNVSKAIDKAAGAERQVVSEGMPVRRMIPGADQNRTGSWIKDNGRVFVPQETQPATPEATQWQGWGTALKPGHEVWWLARKPLTGTVAGNVLAHGTGALNIAGCMVPHASTADLAESRAKNPGRSDVVTSEVDGGDRPQQSVNDAGRWPPNLVLTHTPDCQHAGLRQVRADGHHPAARGRGGLSTSGHAGQEGLAERKPGTETVEAWHCVPGCPVAELDRQSGVLSTCGGPKRTTHSDGMFGIGQPGTVYNDSGGASRFFPVFRYQAKASSAERPRLEDGTAHETVKSLALMQWLVRLVTPPGGLVADLFAGSGPTAEACIIEGFRCVLIEKERLSCDLIRARLRKDIQPAMFGEVS